MNNLKLLWNLYGLKRNTKKTPDQIRILQEKKLRRILEYAYEHSVYYRRTFKDAGITDETICTAPLSAFPAIDKTTFLAHFDELITVSDLTQEEIQKFDAKEKPNRKPFKGKYYVVHSSGSTGKPGYFIYDESAWSSMLLGIIRGALWDMSMLQIIRLFVSGPRIAYIAATDGRYGGAMAVGDGIDGVGGSQLFLDINTPVAEWIRCLQEFRPNIIIGYPSAVKILAELVEHGDIRLDIIRLVTCGEPLGKNLRKYLERIFCTQAVNVYGASESLALGVEKDPKEGMILFDDMNIIEVQDGNMYLTSLYNFSQPLIRYWISDNLTLRKPGETSRYPFTRAEGLLGRDEDMLWFEDGNGNREFLHPLAVEGFCIEGLRDYQFRQTAHDAFEMYAEISADASEDIIRREVSEQMGSILERKGLGYVRFLVNFVDEIRPDKKTGKKSLIVPFWKKEKIAV